MGGIDAIQTNVRWCISTEFIVNYFVIAVGSSIDRLFIARGVVSAFLLMKRFLKKLLGDRGERAAVRFLKKASFRIIARQYRNQFGEIDIIAMDGPQIVFVEVKTRRSTDAGQPHEAVGRRKQQKLTNLALAWLKKHKRLGQSARFDVVSIVWPENSAKPAIEHFKHAFEASGAGQFFS